MKNPSAAWRRPSRARSISPDLTASFIADLSFPHLDRAP